MRLREIMAHAPFEEVDSAGPLVAACSSPTPVLYTSFPGYLDRSHIVRSADDYRRAVTPNDSWGEPLGSMLTRVLAIELSQRPPASNVNDSRDAVLAPPNAEVVVNIQRMDVR